MAEHPPPIPARRARPDDIPALAPFYHDLWQETYAPFMPLAERRFRDVAFFAERLTGLMPLIFVVHQGGEFAAFSAWKTDLLSQIYVAPAFRGSTLATTLLRMTEAALADQGTRDAELHCVVGNERARKLYLRMNWRHDGEDSVAVHGDDGGMVDIPFWRMTKRLRA
jgi:GNAT superfamily N-acetyltransferase